MLRRSGLWLIVCWALANLMLVEQTEKVHAALATGKSEKGQQPGVLNRKSKNL